MLAYVYCKKLFELATKQQAVTTGVGLDCCIGVEMFLIYFTMTSFKEYKSGRSNKYFIALFGLAHLALATIMTRLTSGLFCTSVTFFHSVFQIPMILCSLGTICLVCHMARTVNNIVEKLAFSVIEISLWIIGALYAVSSVVLPTFMKFRLQWLLSIFELLIFVLFCIFSWYLYRKYAELFDAFHRIRKNWLVCNIGLTIIFGLKVLATLSYALRFDNNPRRETGGFSYYFIVSDVINVITPFFLLLYFMKLLSKEVLEKMLEVERPSETLNSIGANMKASFQSAENDPKEQNE